MLSKDRLYSTFLRAAVMIAIDLLVLQTFAFVAKSGVNAGVISIIFSSSIIFTPITFYFKDG